MAIISMMKQLQASPPVEELESEIAWIKTELQKPDSVLHKIYASPSPKKDLILHWMYRLEELHDVGVYKKPVHHISTTVKEELRSMKLEACIPYVHEVAPYKYKNPAYIRGEIESDGEVHPRKDSSEQLDPKEANADYISLLENTILIFKQARKALEKKQVIQPHIPETEWLEFQIRWKYAVDRLQEILDGREKVPPTTMHIMMYCIANYTQSNIYSHYVRFRKEEAELTPKQTGKIIKGHVSKMTLLYEPKSRQQALSSGFYGQQCEECGSWRTDRRYNPNRDRFLLFCFRCSEWTRLKTKKIKVMAK